MVTDGLPTARTQREHTTQPHGSDGNYTTTLTDKNHQHATTTRERTRKKQSDTTNPSSPPSTTSHSHSKLSPRAVEALGGPSRRSPKISLREFRSIRGAQRIIASKGVAIVNRYPIDIPLQEMPVGPQQSPGCPSLI